MDRTKFFAELRHQFGALHQYQVEGFNIILDKVEDKRYEDDLHDRRRVAYILATAWHETSTRMQPVIETRRATEDQNPSVDVAIARLDRAWKAGQMPWVKRNYWKKDKDGKSWLGRGYPQCTGKDNYAKCSKMIGVDFVANPDLMLTPKPAVQSMVNMMVTGGYTGHKLSDYFNGHVDHPFDARRIINATERAHEVEAHHEKMLMALNAAA